MKNNLLLFMLIFVVITGCSKTNLKKETKPAQKNQQNEEFKLGNGFREIENFKCDALKDVKDFAGEANIFITNNGDLYEYDIFQLYSTTEQNCQKIETNKKFVKVIGRYVVDEENEAYSYNLRQLDYRDSITDNRFYVGYDRNTGDKYVLLEDNKIYDYKLDKDLINYVKGEEPIFEIKEKLLHFNGYTIKTDKNYYVYTEEEENPDCHKYVDVDCTYIKTYKKVEIPDFYDNVIYYGYGIILDKNYKIYSNMLGA